MNKKEMFYWFDKKENTFVESYGEKININNYECFILEKDQLYNIIEARSGAFIVTHIQLEKEAIEAAKNIIHMFSEKMDQLIQDSIDDIGISPLYTN
jgi:hypothetical protein